MFGQQISFVIHQVPQPWHPQGTYVHEVALAVKQVQPDLYPAVCRALFAAYDSGKFTDADTWHKSRAQAFDRVKVRVRVRARVMVRDRVTWHKSRAGLR